MMRNIFVLLLLLCSKLYAANYYVSQVSGNDANPGTILLPWKTLTKVNAAMPGMAAGDSILFKRGESFFGTIRIGRNDIKIGAYGTGAKPVITGFVTLTGWTGAAGIFTASNISIKKKCNIFLINGQAQPIARTPNKGTYWYYTSATDSTLIGPNLSAVINYVGAQACIVKNPWTMEKVELTYHSLTNIKYRKADTLNPAGNAGTASQNGNKDYAYFIQNHISCLDSWGEYMAFNGSLSAYFGGTNPSDYIIQASVVDTIINCLAYTGVSIENLQITGGNNFGIYTAVGNNIKINNCILLKNVISISASNTGNLSITNNEIRHSFSTATVVINRQRTNVTFTNNIVDSVGYLMGNGCFNYTKQFKGVTIETDSTRANNTTVIALNTITNIAHAGIEFQGSNITVEKNLIKWVCSELHDNGFIYSFFSLTAPAAGEKMFYNRIVRSNIMLYSNGAPQIKINGLPDVAGIYFDDRSMNISCYGNTVGYLSGNGIQCNNPVNVNLRNNTIFGCTYAIHVNAKKFSSISGLEVKRNVFYGNSSGHYVFSYDDDNLLLPFSQTLSQSVANFVNSDSNYIYTPRSAYNKLAYSAIGTTYVFTDIPLLSWQNSYGHDVNSVVPVAVSGLLFDFNPSNSPKLINYPGQRNADVYGAIHDDRDTLNAWQGKVWLRNGSSPVVIVPTSVDSGTVNGFILSTIKFY
jgi:hypothetical protein